MKAKPSGRPRGKSIVGKYAAYLARRNAGAAVRVDAAIAHCLVNTLRKIYHIRGVMRSIPQTRDVYVYHDGEWR